MTWRPIHDLTIEEHEHLEWIRTIGGKGYIRDYCIKMVHVCPSCNEARGWNNFTECSGCGFKLPDYEAYKTLQLRERWEHIDRGERHEAPHKRQYNVRR